MEDNLSVRHPAYSSLLHVQDVLFASDEDWSQIEDKATRRRIQNKAAQRRYRRKMKSQSTVSEQQDLIPFALDLTSPDRLHHSLDLSWLAENPQRDSDSARGETPASAWDSPGPVSADDISNDILTYIQRQEKAILPSVNLSKSSVPVSPRLGSDPNGHIAETRGSFREAEILRHRDPIPQRVPSVTETIDPLVAHGKTRRRKSELLLTGPENKHADRLLKRIHNNLDELYFLYDIGIELELILQDDDICAQLEALKRTFSKLAVRST